MTSTRRIYHNDPYCRSFDAHITLATEVEGRPAVELDATCFYATSGGQPYDTGTLNGTAVVDVIEQGDRTLHILKQPLGPGPVHGVIDWTRRFDHMQQHTGQHVLSQAFVRELAAETVSFHLGSAVCTIDIARPDLEWDAATRAEELANSVVWDDRTVTVREVAPHDSSLSALRRAPTVEGIIRVVGIDDFDLSACGGTHVRRTGEVGAIQVRRVERRRGQTRIEFLCGGRALHESRSLTRITQGIANGLSVAVEELPQAVARLQESDRTRAKQVEGLRRRLIESELPGLAQGAQAVGGLRVVARVLEDYDAANMRYAAQQLVQQPGMIVLFAVAEPSAQVCFARSSDVGTDVAQLLRAVATQFGGQGGGRPHMAQGGGFARDDLARVLADAKARLEAAGMMTC